MRRVAPALAAALALGPTGCDHGPSQSAALPAPSPYAPRTVQRAFAQAGVPLARDRQTETWARASGDPSSLAAFFTGMAGDVQVTVLRTTEARQFVVALRDADGPVGEPVATTLGNVSVSYERYGSDAPRVLRAEAPRVLRALALLRQARSGKRHSAHLESSRYWQGTDSTGAAFCVVYDNDGAGGQVREGTCPQH